MVDETTDISTTTQLIMYIKYLAKSDDTEDNPGEYESKIGYLDMIIPESGTSIHIKVLIYTIYYYLMLIQQQAIDKVLRDYKLNPKLLVGLGVDGCSTMLGEKQGLAKRLKETSPNMISFHCPTYRFQLALGDIFKDVIAFSN